MARKLPEWLPPNMRPIQNVWTRTLESGAETFKGYRIDIHLGDMPPGDMSVTGLIDDLHQPCRLMLDSWDACIFTDEVLITAIRTATTELDRKAAYDRIAAFLDDPGYYADNTWTQKHFQYEFCGEYSIAEQMSNEGIPEWQLAFDGLLEYWESNNPEAGYVYCLHDQQGHYKLGTTKRLDDRIKQLKTQPPFELTLEFSFKALFARQYEAGLHRHYASKRSRGEWFKLTPDDLTEIKRRGGL